MRIAVCLLFLTFLLAALALISGAASESPPPTKAKSNQGLTSENIGRGIKRAAKNIEEEIPKIGPAIGGTFKKPTGTGAEKGQAKAPTQKSSKPKK